MSAEPLKPGTTFWQATPSGMIEVEIQGQSIQGFQDYRWRAPPGEWREAMAAVDKVRRWYCERADAPESANIGTLADLVKGVMSGAVPADGLDVRVDNDHVSAKRAGETLAHEGDDLSDVLVDLLTGLGVPARRA